MTEISLNRLENELTFITGFMLERTTHFKTYRELHMIFENSYPKYLTEPGLDESDDLRILKFTEDMLAMKWTRNIVLEVGIYTVHGQYEQLINGGIHRGIAILRAKSMGANVKDLPKVYLP